MDKIETLLENGDIDDAKELLDRVGFINYINEHGFSDEYKDLRDEVLEELNQEITDEFYENVRRGNFMDSKDLLIEYMNNIERKEGTVSAEGLNMEKAFYKLGKAIFKKKSHDALQDGKTKKMKQYDRLVQSFQDSYEVLSDVEDIMDGY